MTEISDGELPGSGKVASLSEAARRRSTSLEALPDRVRGLKEGMLRAGTVFREHVTRLEAELDLAVAAEEQARRDVEATEAKLAKATQETDRIRAELASTQASAFESTQAEGHFRSRLRHIQDANGRVGPWALAATVLGVIAATAADGKIAAAGWALLFLFAIPANCWLIWHQNKASEQVTGRQGPAGSK